MFTPGDRRAARAALGLGADELVLAFVGRIQPLKAPDVLLRAAARLTVGHLPLRDGSALCGCWSPAVRPEAACRHRTRWFGSPTNWVSPIT